jgi:RNA polymerase sigma-70 factor, ECF subfamily
MSPAGDQHVKMHLSEPTNTMSVVTDVSAASLPQEQFIVLIARHERRIRSFIAALVSCNRDAIDEVIQSTYLVAWRKLDSFTYLDSMPDEELIRWMCTIARFEVKDFLRRQRDFRVAFDESLIDQIADMQVVESGYFEARHEALANCLGRLAANQRELLNQRYGHNLSVKEVAARQGRQAGAVYTMLSRIRKALERCIQNTLRLEGHCS